MMLAIAALVWIGVHVGIAGTRLRGALVDRLGAGGFRIAFSLLSVASIVFLVEAWKAAETTPLWFAPGWLRWVLALLMLPAFILFVASVAKPNPTAVGGEARLGAEAQGIQRVTRHPMLWSFALWAAIHMIGNGDSAALLFFGAILAGRNRLVLREIGWVPPVAGALAWAAMLHFHRHIFGVAPVVMGAA